MLALILSAIALAQSQPADDGPVATAVRAPSAAEAAPLPKGAKPSTEATSGAAAVAAGRTLSFEPKTKVDGETLQVILGQRAVFKLDAKNRPVVERVEEGKLAAAHPAGKVQETFAEPDTGLMAAALDGSAEKRATVLKVWNGGTKPLEYKALVLILVKDKLTPRPVAVCAVPPGGVHTQSWPAPIVAVGLSRFQPGAAKNICKTTSGD